MKDLRPAFDRLLDVAKAFHEATPGVNDFAPWPSSLVWADKPAGTLPVAKLVRDWYDDRPDEAGAFHRAIKVVSPHAGWQQTYTEEEVGAEYLANYGYFELYGPNGHYKTDELRGFIGYWGSGLTYDWHYHQAEELYAVISGGAKFLSEGQDEARLGPGETHFHAANQQHAIEIRGSAVIVYSIWRGEGMNGRAQLTNSPRA